MPFDFKAYDQKCQGLTLEELQREWEHYTRLISGAATSTAVSGVAIPLTLGVSTIGVAMAAPAIHNARKKREIIERHLNRLNATHHTRKRDVLGSMAVSGTIGVVTLGVGSMGTEAIATAGAEHGIQAVVANETAIKIVSHAALDGAGMAVEHAHTGHLKKKDARKAFQKAGVFQAVQDAKAAEAGYAAQPYQNNNQVYPGYAGSSSSQALPMPPPPYSAAVGQAPVQPAHNTTPNGYPQDFKAPMAQTPIPQQTQPYLTPNVTGQQPLPQSYHYPQQQQHIPPSSAPSPMPPANAQVFSPPQTPAMGYSGHAEQLQPNMYSPQQSIPLQQPPAIAPFNPPASVQPYDMTAMHQALPATTPTVISPYQPPQPQLIPSATLPTSPQNNNQAYISHPTQPQALNHAVQATPTGYFPPGSAAPTGYPPPAIVVPQPTPQPVPAAQVPPPPPAVGSASIPQMPVQHVVQHHTGLQQPATPVMQPQYHQYPGYTSSQSTGPQPQTYVPPPPPPPPPVDPSRRHSIMSIPQPSFTPHAPYNPQNYGPISKQEQVHNSATYATNGIPQATQVTQPPMQYHMAPPTPLSTGSMVNQYQQNSNGSYFPASPPVEQSQKVPVPGQPWQATQPGHQHYPYPPANYPPTPMSMPSPMPMTQ
ncbi:hypothetical protein NW762_006209 [Fusarium torreyae]|uniref:Uncharacterized protein n=1 Tax=Fusarium torreyae TaxID=1237075 RepID=A0A9W8VHD6_9HYPO|nr:hypothetical protein NW762_006209 [Fusarium torreyae]